MGHPKFIAQGHPHFTPIGAGFLVPVERSKLLQTYDVTYQDPMMSFSIRLEKGLILEFKDTILLNRKYQQLLFWTKILFWTKYFPKPICKKIPHVLTRVMHLKPLQKWGINIGLLVHSNSLWEPDPVKDIGGVQLAAILRDHITLSDVKIIDPALRSLYQKHTTDYNRKISNYRLNMADAKTDVDLN